MFAIVLWVLIGFGMAFFATQNVSTVSITLADYTFVDVPLYAIVIGSLLLGLVLSWVISTLNGVSSMLTIHNKDSAIKNANQKVEELKRENRKLELEVAKVKGENRTEAAFGEKLDKRPSLWNRWRHMSV